MSIISSLIINENFSHLTCLLCVALTNRTQRQVRPFWAASLSTGSTGKRHIAPARTSENDHTRRWLTPSASCVPSMVFRGHKQPLVQEDMWDLNNQDSTGNINGRFQHYMSQELQKARVRYQEKLRTKPSKGKDPEELYENVMGKGISQDVLMMVRKSSYIVVYILSFFFFIKTGY